MSDRTAVHLTPYQCPPEQSWAIAQVIEEFALTDHEAGTYAGGTRIAGAPWDFGYLELGHTYLGTGVACGSADDIAAFLQAHAPDACWRCWEDPACQWLGELFVYTPDLGLWTAACDADGEAVLHARAVLALLRNHTRTAAEHRAGAAWQQFLRQQSARSWGRECLVRVGNTPGTS